MTNSQISKMANYTALTIIILSLMFAIYTKSNPKPTIRIEKKEIENIMWFYVAVCKRNRYKKLDPFF